LKKDLSLLTVYFDTSFLTQDTLKYLFTYLFNVKFPKHIIKSSQIKKTLNSKKNRIVKNFTIRIFILFLLFGYDFQV
jgi:hypothetical protein